MLQAKLTGAKELEGLLKEFPLRIQRDIINSVAARGAAVVKKHAKKNLKQNGSVLTGDLLKSIKTKKMKGVHGVYSIFTAKKAFYSHFIEFGTNKMAAKPFFRPAIDENTDEIMMEMKTRMAKRMAKEAVKMSAKYRSMSKTYRKKLAK